MKVGIMGYGFVGKATHKSLTHPAIIYDPAIKKFSSENQLKKIMKTDACFLCVPTPTLFGSQQTGILKTALESLKGYKGLVIIKSTILPSTWDEISDSDLNLMVAPEFLSQHDPYHGGASPIGITDIDQVDLYRKLAPIIDVTDPRTACMIKYVHNCYGALKVAFFHEIFEVCEEENISYREMLRILLNTTTHIGKTYTRPLLDGKPGFGGACFPKDTSAFQKDYGLRTLAAALNLNSTWRPL